jgi:hypothetical protein
MPFSTPRKLRPKKCTKSVLDDFDEAVLRRIVHNFYLTEKERPTLKAIHAKIRESKCYEEGVSLRTRGRSVHVLTGGCKGGSQVFLSFTFMRHLYRVYYHLFSLLTGPFRMLNACHITHIITISYSSVLATFICAYHNSSFAPSVCAYQDSPSSSVFMNLFVSGHIAFIKLLSHQQGSFLSPWCCPTVSARLPTCVCLRATQM